MLFNAGWFSGSWVEYHHPKRPSALKHIAANMSTDYSGARYESGTAYQGTTKRAQEAGEFACIVGILRLRRSPCQYNFRGRGLLTDGFDRVVYLLRADHSAGLVWSCPHDVNRTVMTSHIGFSRPGGGRWPWLKMHVIRLSS